MERESLDVLHLDDDSSVTEIVGRRIENAGKTYFSVNDLAAFSEALDRFIPLIAVIDGRFPEKSGGTLAIRTGEALSILRSRPDSAGVRAVVYSGEDRDSENGPFCIARQYGVGFHEKGNLSYREFSNHLLGILEGKT